MMLAPLLSGFVALCSFGDQPDRPPPLTFDEHVDYIAWWNDVLSRDKTENAFPLYKGLYPDESDRGGMPELQGAAKEQFDQIGIGIWEAKDYPDFASYLQECAAHLDTLRNATQLKDFWQPISPDTKLLLSLKLPTLSPSRHGSKMIIVRAWMKQENQAEAIMDAHRITLRTADHMQQNCLLIGGLVGTAERALVYESVLSALDEDIIAGKDIKRTYRTLRKHDPGSPDWIVMLNFEWAVQLDMLQFACPDGKLNDDRWRTMAATSRRQDPPSNTGFDPREANTLIDELFEQMQRIVDGPIDVKKRDRMREHEESESSKIRKNAFTRLLYPRLSRAYELTVRTEAHRRGTMLALAVHAHHAKHGKWPKNLKKIDKKLGLKGLKRLRTDPFSGKSFKYESNGGKPLLYSIGADGKDDGGRHDPKWGEGESGGDFVFWPRRPRPPQRP